MPISATQDGPAGSVGQCMWSSILTQDWRKVPRRAVNGTTMAPDSSATGSLPDMQRHAFVAAIFERHRNQPAFLPPRAGTQGSGSYERVP